MNAAYVTVVGSLATAASLWLAPTARAEELCLAASDRGEEIARLMVGQHPTVRSGDTLTVIGALDILLEPYVTLDFPAYYRAVVNVPSPAAGRYRIVIPEDLDFDAEQHGKQLLLKAAAPPLACARLRAIEFDVEAGMLILGFNAHERRLVSVAVVRL